ncbi:MAG: thiamine-phosphate kinase [Candidatus Omnitrophica bacterium]|jgi:thiamine-monophosphate kinase|nr:thiamine-phosphate kinase [Candidatus Omnitrophota bacterium]
MKDKKNTLARLGEFGLIRRLTKGLKADASVAVGPGDDCAAIRVSAKEYLLLTADMLVEGVDFLAGERPELVGRKALAVSLSDIAACGGTPRYALVSLGIPAACPYDRVAAIFNGMKRLAGRYNVNIVGGDISRCAKLVLNISVAGFAAKGRLVTRSGAKPGDVIFVSGSLGGSIKGRHLRFTPRVREAAYLTANFKVTSMIDVSDGLWQDLGHLMSASGTGAVIYADRLPLSGAASGIEDAISSGEDFELLFTMPLAEASRLLRAKNGFVFRQIGFVLSGNSGMRLVGKDLRPLKVKKSGYRHF